MANAEVVMMVPEPVVSYVLTLSPEEASALLIWCGVRSRELDTEHSTQELTSRVYHALYKAGVNHYNHEGSDLSIIKG